jgi:hypothetical protein
MAPSSPPEKRTLHLLKTPDILCANDNRLLVNYYFVTDGLATTQAQPGESLPTDKVIAPTGESS